MTMFLLTKPTCPCPPAGAAIPSVLVVPIQVDECWSVDLHWRGPERTPTGDLLHEAKTYGGKPGTPEAADRLAICLGWWARQLRDVIPVSQIQRADVVTAVPCNPPKFPHNLPDVLARGVGTALGVRCNLSLLRKRSGSEQVKLMPSKPKKMRALSSLYQVCGDVAGQVVVVIDDVVLSGATLEIIGDLLKAAGADRVIALTATRATKGLQDRSAGDPLVLAP